MGDQAVADVPTMREVPHEHPEIHECYEQHARLSDFAGFDWKAQGSKVAAVNFARIRDYNETGMSVNEVGLLYDCLELMGRGHIVELGRNYGTSSRLFLQHVIRHGGTLESWDLKVWPGFIEAMEAAGYPQFSVPSAPYGSRVYRGEGYEVITRLAHSVKTPITDPRDRLGYPNCVERFVDFLLIDTEHGLEDALGEYMRWRLYLKGGAFVAFHDATLPGVARAIELVQEIERTFTGRLAEHHVNAQVDGYGLEVFRWQG